MKQINFCTLFDKNYTAFGLALIKSTFRFVPQAKYYVLTLDEMSYKVLKDLDDDRIKPFLLADVSPAYFNSDKYSYPQKCWISQPHFCKFLLTEQNLDHVIYMDSDCYFLKSPIQLIENLMSSEISATIVPHNYSKDWIRYLPISGKYCVQFNYFKNDSEGLKIVDTWLADNLKYDRLNPDKVPGQLSLDTWLNISQKVKEISDPNYGSAIWNIQNFSHNTSKDIVFYHFHALSFLSTSKADFGSHKLPDFAKKIYFEYCKEVISINRQLNTKYPGQDFIRFKKKAPGLKNLLRRVKARIEGRRNIYDIKAQTA